jgi:hypothetical protein
LNFYSPRFDYFATTFKFVAPLPYAGWHAWDLTFVAFDDVLEHGFEVSVDVLFCFCEGVFSCHIGRDSFLLVLLYTWVETYYRFTVVVTARWTASTSEE